eukprot:SAG11_NODE_392_length_9837_cov_9.732183_6_plen_111_part_00
MPPHRPEEEARPNRPNRTSQTRQATTGQTEAGETADQQRRLQSTASKLGGEQEEAAGRGVHARETERVETGGGCSHAGRTGGRPGRGGPTKHEVKAEKKAESQSREESRE